MNLGARGIHPFNSPLPLPLNKKQNLILFKSGLHSQTKEKHIQQLTACMRLRLFRKPPSKFRLASELLIHAYVVRNTFFTSLFN